MKTAGSWFKKATALAAFACAAAFGLSAQAVNVAEVGDTEYATLWAAFKAANGASITMTADGYTADATKVPSGYVLDAEHKLITLNDMESFLYYGLVFNMESAHTAWCAANPTANPITSPYYSNNSVQGGVTNVILNCSLDFENATVTGGFNYCHPFNGSGKTVSNLNVAGVADEKNGFFKSAGYGPIQDLTLDGIVVTGAESTGGGYNGILVGCFNGSGIIKDITIKNSSVTNGKYTGAVCGSAEGASCITCCSLQNVSVTGQYKCGGVVGYFALGSGTASVTNNTLTSVQVLKGNVLSGKSFIGGKIVGNYNASGDCWNDYAGVTGDVTAQIGRIEDGCTVNEVSPTPAVTYVAQVGETTYPTLKAAADAATSGQTIELITDYTVASDEVVEIKSGVTFTAGSYMLTNNGTVKVAGTTKFSAGTYTGNIIIGNVDAETTLTTDGLAVNGTLLIVDGSIVKLSGSGFASEALGIRDSVSEKNETEHTGYTLILDDADGFNAQNIYVNGDSTFTLTNNSTNVRFYESNGQDGYLNVYGGVANVTEGSSLYAVQSFVTGTINIDGTSTLEVAYPKIHCGPDGKQGGVINVNGGTFKATGLEIGQLKGDGAAKYYVDGADQTARLNIKAGSTVRVTGALSNAGVISIDMTGATADSYTLIDASGTVDYGTEGMSYRFAEGKDNGYALKVVDGSLYAVKAADPLQPEGSTKVVDGFYQNAATYGAATEFYITNLSGFHFFRDLINQENGAIDDYIEEGFYGSTADNFYTENPFKNKTVKLLCDVDEGDVAVKPIGMTDKTREDGKDKRYFYGIFDGCNHTISNLRVIDTTAADKRKIGLFGTVTRNADVAMAGVVNLTVSNAVVSGYRYVGGFIGGLSGAVTLTNCHLKGSVTLSAKSKYLGGLVGHNGDNVDSQIIACSVDVSVGSTLTTGSQGRGLVGYMGGGDIIGCTVRGLAINASGSYVLGGIAGKFATAGCVAASNTVDSVTITAKEAGASGSIIGSFGAAGQTLIDNTVVNTHVYDPNDVEVFGQCHWFASGDTTTVIGWNSVGTLTAGGITGGTFERLPTSYLALGYELVAQGTTPETYVVQKAPVCKIGETKYTTLEAAVDAATSGDTIQMIADVEYEEITSPCVLTFPATKMIALDLNGKTISGYNALEKNSTFISVKGNLTVTDSSADKDGKIVIDPLNACPSSVLQETGGYGSYCISLTSGSLTVEAGTIENKGTGGACYAIEVGEWAGSGDVTINGGLVKAATTAFRFYECACTSPMSLTMTGGKILSGTGSDGVMYQGESKGTEIGANITISGGEIAGGRMGIFVYGSSGDVNINVSDEGIVSCVGGYGAIYHGSGTLADGKSADTVTVSGGYVKDLNENRNKAYSICWWDGNSAGGKLTVTGGASYGYVWCAGTITSELSGGVYSAEPDEAYVKEGYAVAANTDAGTKAAYPWTIVEAYTITYELGTGYPTGATVPTSPTNYVLSATETALPKPTYDSELVTFNGWLFGGGTYVGNAIPAGMTGAVTLTATWTEARKIEVKTNATEQTPTVEIKVTQEWIDKNVTKAKTTENIQEKLNEEDPNGNLKWQNYVIGLDPTNQVAGIAEQNDDEKTVTVVPNAATPQADTGFTVRYSLDTVETNGKVVTEGAATTMDNLNIDLDSVTSNAFYKVNVIVTKDGASASEATKIAATNTLGVLKVNKAPATSIVAVPWNEVGGTAITVSNYVKTATLTAGDELYIYKKDGTYSTWMLDGDKTWYSTDEDQGKAASDETIARGSAVWIKRQDTTKPLVLFGQATDQQAEAKLEAAGTKPSWNIVASPTVSPIDLNETFTAAKSVSDEGDRIIVPTDGTPKNYTYTDGAWGYDTITVMTNKLGRIINKPVRVTTDTEVPAGVGFWYINPGAEKTIKW